jgi:hypothetical protein
MVAVGRGVGVGGVVSPLQAAKAAVERARSESGKRQ